MSSLDDTSDTMNKVLIWSIVGYVVGGLLTIAFWGTVIYFIVRACKAASERPREIHIHHDQQQPQIQYIIHQELQIGPDGRPVVYANQLQPGQYYYYAQGTPAATMAHQQQGGCAQTKHAAPPHHVA